MANGVVEIGSDVELMMAMNHGYTAGSTELVALNGCLVNVFPDAKAGLPALDTLSSGVSATKALQDLSSLRDTLVQRIAQGEAQLSHRTKQLEEIVGRLAEEYGVASIEELDARLAELNQQTAALYADIHKMLESNS